MRQKTIDQIARRVAHIEKQDAYWGEHYAAVKAQQARSNRLAELLQAINAFPVSSSNRTALENEIVDLVLNRKENA